MMLNIQTGPQSEPLRVLVHGQPGVGKTTFASGAPRALFLSAEEGTGDLDLARVYVGTWPDAVRVLEQIRDGAASDYDTLVIDTADALNRLIEMHVAAAFKCASVAEIPYGRGAAAVVTEHVRAMALLDAIRQRARLAVIVLSHSKIKNFDDPAGPAYARWQLSMPEGAVLAWVGWADCVLFAQMDVRVDARGRGGNKADAKGKARDESPERLLCTEWRAQYEAKNRIGLPAELPLAWSDFAAAAHWGDRMARWTRKPAAASPQAAPTSDGLRAAGMRAQESLGWKRADVIECLERHGMTDGKPASIPVSRRADCIAALSLPFDNTQPNNTQHEAKDGTI